MLNNVQLNWKSNAICVVNGNADVNQWTSCALERKKTTELPLQAMDSIN